MPLVYAVFGAHCSLFCRALVYVCHGVGEYMGRYDELGSYLSQNSLLVFGHDHGKSNYVHVI